MIKAILIDQILGTGVGIMQSGFMVTLFTVQRMSTLSMIIYILKLIRLLAQK